MKKNVLDARAQQNKQSVLENYLFLVWDKAAVQNLNEQKKNSTDLIGLSLFGSYLILILIYAYQEISD